MPGGADDSYGIEVSKLAGVPDWIIRRARQVLGQLEEGKEVSPAKKKRAEAVEGPQISFEAVIPSEVEAALRQVDVNTLTPIEALNKLYELKSLLKD